MPTLLVPERALWLRCGGRVREKTFWPPRFRDSARFRAIPRESHARLNLCGILAIPSIPLDSGIFLVFFLPILFFANFLAVKIWGKIILSLTGEPQNKRKLFLFRKTIL